MRARLPFYWLHAVGSFPLITAGLGPLLFNGGWFPDTCQRVGSRTCAPNFGVTHYRTPDFTALDHTHPTTPFSPPLYTPRPPVRACTPLHCCICCGQIMCMPHIPCLLHLIYLPFYCCFRTIYFMVSAPPTPVPFYYSVPSPSHWICHFPACLLLFFFGWNHSAGIFLPCG